MTIGEMIRKMRRARDITQEELAELLHITPQAVSRWETDTTTPDVTSVIGLARIFDCSADDILCLNEVKKTDRIKYYSDIAAQAARNGDEECGLKACRDALTEFPNDYSMMRELANYLNFYSENYMDTDPEKYNAMMKEARGLYEYILAHCMDEKILMEVRSSMCSILVELGEHAKAEEYVKNLPDIWKCREIAMLSYAEDRHAASLALAGQAYHILQWSLQYMIYNKQEGFSAGERAEIAEKIEALHRLFYGDVTATERPNYFTALARAYAMAQDTGNTLRCLKSAAEMAAEYDAKDYNNGYVYKIETVPFKGEAMVAAMRNSPNDYRDDVAEVLAESLYDFIRDTPEFVQILSIITK